MDRANQLFDLLRGGRRDKAVAVELARVLNERSNGSEYAERDGRVVQTKYPTPKKAD